MEDIEMVRAMDLHMVRARAFNKAVEHLQSWNYFNAAEEVRHLYDAEIAAFDALWDKYQAGRPPTPPAAL